MALTKINPTSKSYYRLNITSSSSVVSPALSSPSSESVDLDVSDFDLLPIGGKYHPLNFEEFLPRLCVYWNIPPVRVITRVQDDFLAEFKVTKAALFKRKRSVAPEQEKEKSVTETAQKNLEPAVELVAIYDRNQNLVEISISEGSLEFELLHWSAISACLPYHNFLKKVVLHGKLPDDFINTIIDTFSMSCITEISLNYCQVKEANYYNLLDCTNIRHLSLRGCGVTDGMVAEIAKRLHFGKPAASTLQMLDLSCNIIGDCGAKLLGKVFRLNRDLLLLNLASNRITDIGVGYLLRYLKPFNVNFFELKKANETRTEYLQKLAALLRQHKQNFQLGRTPVSKKSLLSAAKKAAKRLSDDTTAQLGPAWKKHILSELHDTFPTGSVFVKKGFTYCIGNMKFCSLNLSYNDLTIYALKLIDRLLCYQSDIRKPSKWTGLLRLKVDGNWLPSDCEELSNITKSLLKLMSPDQHYRTKVMMRK